MFLQEIIQNIIPFYLMIVNYDKKNGWSSVFDGGINSFFKGNLNESDASFVKNIKTIQNSLGTISSKNIDRLANSIGGVSTELVDSAKAVRSGKQSWADFDATVTQVTKSTSKFSSFTSKAGTALKSFGSSVLSMGANMLAGMAIGAVISGVITLIDDCIHRNERLIEAGEEAKSSIESTFNEFTDSKSSITDLGKSLSDNADEIITTGDAIDTLAEKYTKLRDGVSSVDNSNKFLSDEDYQSYLDISNQIAEQFPSLVSGYDAQGNAILNLGNNASTAASQLTELYNASMLSANVEIGNELDDRYAGVEAQIKEYQDEITTWQNTIDKNKELVSAATPSVSDILGGEIEFASNAFGDQTQQVAKEINDVLSKYGLTNRRYSAPDGTIKINTTGITEDIAQEIASVYDKYSQDAVDNFAIDNAELEQKIAANKQLIQDQWNSMAESLGQYLQTNPTFTKLDSGLQNAFLGNISEIDASAIGEEYDGDVQQFLYSEIINPLSEMKPEAQQALADLVQFDPSNLKIDEYSDLVSKALYNAFPDDADMQNQMRKTFGFDKAIEEAETQADKLKHTLGEKFSDAIDSMSLDELDKAYDLVIDGGEAFSTIDELQDAIKQTQALAATSVDLNVHTGMDAIAAALESENAGADYENAVSYLEQAKDLFDQGLIGTDDFKSIASYLSPTGADDAINFVENYGKALRYLTEDGTGVQNFLEDLASKGYASMETLSDGTQQWKYNIDDLEDAATNMGIGFEFMMDMFGRLEDYGFSNNFVGSVEDGAQRISDLSSQLVDAEAELARLEASGADQTAIDQQREKVQGLRNDLLETQDALSQLVQRSADDYAKQVETARQSIQSLGEERERILRENAYGDDTQAVADLMEQQMQQWASENGLELDANLNIKEPEQPPQIEVKAEITSTILDPQLEAMRVGDTTTVKANVDGELNYVNALKNADGTITYTAKIDGVEQELSRITHEDGEVTFTADTSDVEDKINGLVSNDGKTITMDVLASTDDIEYALQNLQDNQTLYFTAEIDGNKSGIAAAFDENGEIKYTANINDVEVSLEKVKDEEGNITYKADYDSAIENLDVEATVDYLLGEQEDPELKQAFVDYIKNNQQDPEFRTAFMNYLKAGQDDPDAKNALLDYILNNQENPIDLPAGVSYYKTGQEAPSEKTVGVWYKIKGVIGSIANFITGGSGLTGTAHIEGTIPHLSGRALAMGTLQDESWLNPNWRTKKSEVALTGEEGQELVVTRANRWYTVGDHGAEFANIPQGSVVFNAQQTKELLSKGRINSRGTAMIGGSAFAGGSGGGGFFIGQSGSSSGMSGAPSSSPLGSSKKSDTSTKKAAEATQQAADAAKEAADEFEESFDQIEILLDRMDRSLQKLTDSIETYSYDLSKQSSVSDQAMNQIRNNLTTLQQAYNRYIQEANSVGLDESWKRIVQSGKLDITTVTDESLMDKINDYQDWWKISRQCKIFLMLGTPESLIYHNVVMKYGQA